jgi:hypothetical protein
MSWNEVINAKEGWEKTTEQSTPMREGKRKERE